MLGVHLQIIFRRKTRVRRRPNRRRSSRRVPQLRWHHRIHAVYPPGARPSVKVRLFLEHFVACIGDPPRWESPADMA